MYLLLLANPVSPVHGLQVHLWIPVGVVEDDDVGRVQVDAEASRAGGQHEDEFLAALGVVLLDLTVAVLVGGLTVNAAVAEVDRDIN